MESPLYCVNHPAVETYLRCNKCGDPICARCAVQTPVGYRCRRCIQVQQQVFYADFRPIYYGVAFAIALPLALLAGWLIPRLGWFAIILGPLTGGGIAELVLWATRQRRGRYTWLIVCGCIVLGMLWGILSFLIVITLSLLSNTPRLDLHIVLNLVWAAVYGAAATGTAYAMLRPGRKVY